MKKMMTTVALLAATTFTSSALTSCDREDLITVEKLPSESRNFLKAHFDGVEVVSVVREIDGLKKDYSVYLRNGMEVDFRRSGVWDEVEGNRQAVPASFVATLPEGIEAYVTANYPDRSIVRVSREDIGFEVELSRPAASGTDPGTNPGNSHDGQELDFTASGQFMRLDD